MDMMTSLKFQAFTNLCMSDLEFDTPAEFMELLKQSVEYITDGADLTEGKTSGSVLNIVN